MQEFIVEAMNRHGEPMMWDDIIEAALNTEIWNGKDYVRLFNEPDEVENALRGLVQRGVVQKVMVIHRVKLMGGGTQDEAAVYYQLTKPRDWVSF